MLAEPAAKVAAPVTSRAPLSVMAPLVVTLTVPLTVLASSTKALMSLSMTLLPLVIPTEEKSLALLSVMSLAEPAAKVAAPVTSRAPLSVMAPLVVTFRVPLIVLASSIRALMSLSMTFLPLSIPTDEKSLALLSVISLAKPASKVATLPTTRAPLWVMAPLVVTSSVPLMVLASSTRELISVMTTS